MAGVRNNMAARPVSITGRTIAGSERLTSLSTATTMTPTASAMMARVYVESGEVRVIDNGDTVTTTTGAIVGEGTYEDFWNPDEGSIIETSAGSIVTVVYY